MAGFDIAGRNIACEEVGGDYYDFLAASECREDHFGVVVGDVTDHGATAALLMATARAFLRMRASQCGAISQIVTEMNRQLTRDVLDSGRFMTLGRFVSVKTMCRKRSKKWKASNRHVCHFNQPPGR